MLSILSLAISIEHKYKGPIMKKILFSFLVFSIALVAQTKQNQIVVPAIFSDNMVLQQKSDVTFWGRAETKAKINLTASWGKKAKTIAKDDNTWIVKIKTPKAGGPYEVKLTIGDSTITYKNVLIGEVWLCSGQSNMEMPLAGWPPKDTIHDATKEIPNANYSNLRLFTVTRAYSIKPEYNVKGTWEQCTPQTASSFSATAFFFGKKLMNDLKIPIGLIHSSWGGTPAEAWTGLKQISEFPNYKNIVDLFPQAVNEFENLKSWLASHKTIDVSSGDDNVKWQNIDFGDSICKKINYDDSQWFEMNLPGIWERDKLGDFDGTVWYRKTIEIPETWIGKELELHLGPIDDMDATFVNGELIGALEKPGFWQYDRIYSIPDSIVKEKKLLIAVRVIDPQGGGGIYAQKEKFNLVLKNSNETFSIAGVWKYMPVAEYLSGVFYLFNPDQLDYLNRPKTSIQLSPNSPTVLNNAMIAPLVPYKIKGAIWYQGESNVGRAQEYKLLFPKMIESWRDAWKDKFSFYFTQIAPYRYEGNISQELREAQFLSMAVPKSGMAVTMDISDIDNIHPGNKKDVGERLALWALNKDYRKKLVYSGPVYKSSVAKDGKMILTFEHAKGLEIKLRGGKNNFQIAGEDKVFKEAIVEVNGNKLIVFSNEIADPKAVRYCWSDIDEGTLFNGAGLPASSFRTDN